jgi:selenocysteine lyase/cysteine desulfurase
MLGWHGIALLGWNRERLPEVEPAIMGWHSPASVPDREQPKQYEKRADAARFEVGNPSYAGIFILENALYYVLDAGIDRIAEHDRYLSGMLNRQLRELGLDVSTPLDPACRAGNTCFWHPEAEEVARRLAAERVWVNGSDGRIRIGTHLWCSEADVERTAAAVERAVHGQ